MFTLPPLNFSYQALEPYIDAQTMEIHHSKHHQAYIDKFNAALEKYPELLAKKAEDIITDLKNIPAEISKAVQNHGGGYVNHKFFWTILSPEKQTIPARLETDLVKNFTSVDKFKEQFEAAAMGQFGSGWAWLVKDKAGQLEIMATANQDSPLSVGKTPLLAVDVWEHAYYLKYQNRRQEYLTNFWSVVNWEQVEDYSLKY